MMALPLGRVQNRLLEMAALGLILLLGAGLRFYQVETRPGFEWDEPVYASIALYTMEYGYPTLRPEADQPMQPYLYHPPFDFFLRGLWFGLLGAGGIGQARLLAAAESMVLLILVYGCVRYLTDPQSALIALLLVASDSWIVLTNRYSLIENSMMPIAVAGVWLYAVALRRGQLGWYVLAGSVLSFAAVYKHTGLNVLLIPPITWLLIRKDTRQHAVMLGAAALVMAGYVVGMAWFWGDVYIQHTWVQVMRVVGNYESRGLNFGVGEAAQAIVQRYWVFFTTVSFAFLGAALVVGRLFQPTWTLWVRILKERGALGKALQVVVYRVWHRPLMPVSLMGRAVLLSWCLSAIIFLGSLKIKSPFYLIVLLVPALALVAAEAGRWLAARSALSLAWMLGLAALAVNLLIWNDRILVQADNALLDTYQYVDQHIPADARLLTEEPIGLAVQPDYYKLDMHQGESDLRRVQPTHVIIYLSTTQKPPDSDALSRLLDHSTLMTEIRGFKERIQIYQVNPDAWVR